MKNNNFDEAAEIRKIEMQDNPKAFKSNLTQAKPQKAIPYQAIKNAPMGFQRPKTEALKPIKGYTSEQLALIKRTVAFGASNDELAMFMHIAKKSGLDPFLKEIWFYKDNKGNTIILTGRDGFLSLAKKSGEFMGIQSAAIYEGDEFSVDYSNPEDIKIKHITNPFKKDAGKVVGAWARSRRKNCIDTVEIIEEKNYHKSWTRGESLWDKYNSAMAKKVAEAIALKKQFGISGLISTEEMGFENEKENPKELVDSNKLFEEIKTLIQKVPEQQKNQTIDNAIRSGQFSEEQNLELESFKILNEKTDATQSKK